MVNQKPAVLAALRTVPGVAHVFFYYPNSFARMPCISYYELANVPSEAAEDAEYRTESQFAVDVWGDTSEQVDGIAVAVDTALAAIGGWREFCADVYDPGTVYRHKNMRYQLIGG